MFPFLGDILDHTAPWRTWPMPCTKRRSTSSRWWRWRRAYSSQTNDNWLWGCVRVCAKGYLYSETQTTPSSRGEITWAMGCPLLVWGRARLCDRGKRLYVLHLWVLWFRGMFLMSLMFCVCVSDSCGGFLCSYTIFDAWLLYAILMGLDEWLAWLKSQISIGYPTEAPCCHNTMPSFLRL